jgi:hypothetical protein
MKYKVMWSTYRRGKGIVSSTVCASLNEAVERAKQSGGIVFDDEGKRLWPKETFSTAAERETTVAERP